MAERNDNMGIPQGGAQGKGSTSTNMGADKSGKAQGGLTDDREQGATNPNPTGGRTGSDSPGTKQGGYQNTPASEDRSRDQDRANTGRQRTGTDATLENQADDASEATTEDDTQGGPGDAKRTTAQREGDTTNQERKGGSNDRGLH